MRKTILISGAAAGIGRATAELFHRNGWAVGLTDIDAAALAALARTLEAGRVWSRVLDVTDADAAREVVDAFAADHLLLVDVNITGIINLSHAAYRHLRGTSGAMVVNMSSASALHGTPDFATYSATKAAVRALTEALEIEWRDEGIAVRDIMPPFVDTGMVRSNQSVLIDRFGVRLSAADVAAAVWDTVTSRSAQLHRAVGWQFRLTTLANEFLPSRLMHEGLRWMSHRRRRER